MIRLKTGYRTLAFDLDADPDLLCWVEEFFSETPTRPDNKGNLWRISAHLGAPRLEGTHLQTLQGFTFDGRFSEHKATRDEHGRLWIAGETEALTYVLDKTQRTVEVVSPVSDSPTRVAVMRVVRELATTACLRDGLVPIHGSAFVRDDGSAVMVCGPKCAGKTSLLVHALRSGATYLANDRVMLEPTAPFVAHGMPTIVSLRPGMLDLFEGFKEALTDHRPGSPNASVGLTPAKFSRLLGAPVLGRAPLGMLLFPRVDTSVLGLRFDRLDPEDCSRALAQNLLRASDPIRSSEVFTLGPSREVLEPQLEAAACRGVASLVPAYACVLGRGAFDTHPKWPDLSERGAAQS